MTSRYDVQIEHYLKHFPIEQFFFVKHETYFKEVASGFADLCAWLDISVDHVPDVSLKRGATSKKHTRTSRFPLVNLALRMFPGLKRQLTSRVPYKY